MWPGSSFTDTPGLRAAERHGEECAAAQLLIAVLAYQCVQVIRRRLMARGIDAGWPVLRQTLALDAPGRHHGAAGDPAERLSGTAACREGRGFIGRQTVGGDVAGAAEDLAALAGYAATGQRHRLHHARQVGD